MKFAGVWILLINSILSRRYIEYEKIDSRREPLKPIRKLLDEGKPFEGEEVFKMLEKTLECLRSIKDKTQSNRTFAELRSECTGKNDSVVFDFFRDYFEGNSAVFKAKLRGFSNSEPCASGNCGQYFEFIETFSSKNYKLATSLTLNEEAIKRLEDLEKFEELRRLTASLFERYDDALAKGINAKKQIMEAIKQEQQAFNKAKEKKRPNL